MVPGTFVCDLTLSFNLCVCMRICVVPGAFVWNFTWYPGAFVWDLAWSLAHLYGILHGPWCVCMESCMFPGAFVWNLAWSLAHLYGILSGTLVRLYEILRPWWV